MSSGSSAACAASPKVRRRAARGATRRSRADQEVRPTSNLSALRKKRSLGAMALLVFFSAAAGTRIVAPDFIALDYRLLHAGRTVAADELQLRHFLFFLALDIAREILHRC